MRKSPTSDREVTRLKKLLFDEEQRALAHVRKLVGDHHERIGTDKRFQHSVAEIIADALRDAEISHHRELAAAISPVVVAGIRREIANSRDEMVDALYPILGRLVSAYVSNAVRELMDEANAQLESRLSARRLRLRFKSLVTGRPYGELVLASAQRFQVQEILLIRRGSGILLDRWQAEPAEEDESEADDESLVSGLLTAITDFAEEAFADESTQLRTLDIGTGRIHLRATPAYLVALICAGPETGRFRKRLDKELFRILDEYADVLGALDEAEDKPRLRAILPTLAERLSAMVEEEKRPPVLAAGLLVLIGACIAGAIGWSTWTDLQSAKIRARVESVIARQGGLSGYPLTVRVASDRSKVFLSGLAPSPEAGSKLVSAVQQAISPIPLESGLAFVPTAASLRRTLAELTDLAGKLRELERELAVAAKSDALSRVSRRVDGMATRIGEVETRLAEAATERTVSGVSGRVADLAGRLDRADERLAKTAKRKSLEGLAGDVGTLRRQIGEIRDRLAQASSRRDLEPLSAELSRLGTQLAGVERKLSLLPASSRMQQLAASLRNLSDEVNDPRRKLGQWVEANAIFFGEETAFRTPELVRGRLETLSRLVMATDASLRVIGYTDETGRARKNEALAAARARRIADQLVDLGVPRERMIVVGRTGGPYLNDQKGPDSGNRRVEFELAFHGEQIPAGPHR